MDQDKDKTDTEEKENRDAVLAKFKATYTDELEGVEKTWSLSLLPDYDAKAGKNVAKDAHMLALVEQLQHSFIKDNPDQCYGLFKNLGILAPLTNGNATDSSVTFASSSQINPKHKEQKKTVWEHFSQNVDNAIKQGNPNAPIRYEISPLQYGVHKVSRNRPVASTKSENPEPLKVEAIENNGAEGRNRSKRRKGRHGKKARKGKRLPPEPEAEKCEILEATSTVNTTDFGSGSQPAANVTTIIRKSIDLTTFDVLVEPTQQNNEPDWIPLFHSHDEEIIGILLSSDAINTDNNSDKNDKDQDEVAEVNSTSSTIELIQLDHDVDTESGCDDTTH